MRDPNKPKGRHKLVRMFESQILRIQDDAVPQNTKRASKFGLKVFKGKKRLHTFAKQCLTSFSRYLLLKIKQSSRGQQFVSLGLILFAGLVCPAKRIG